VVQKSQKKTEEQELHRSGKSLLNFVKLLRTLALLRPVEVGALNEK
jgi:hypothetical protein